MKSFDQLKTNKFIITNFKKNIKKKNKKHTNYKMNTKSQKKKQPKPTTTNMFKLSIHLVLKNLIYCNNKHENKTEII